MLGGKLIDQGRYGCIFSPPLKCKDTPKKITPSDNPLTYGKFTITKDATTEFNIAKKISKINLWKNYFVISETMCSVSKEQTDKDLDKCKVFKEYTISNFKSSSMPFGGTPVSKYQFHKSFDFMTFVTHLIEAGALLNLYNIVHRDLHYKNIIIDKYDVPRIIDFNLAIDRDKPFKIKPHNYNYDYYQESPDYTLFNAIKKGYNPQTVMNTIITKKSSIKDAVMILNVSKTDMLADLESFYNKNRNLNFEQWFEKYWRTIDSWAIGSLIVSDIIKHIYTSELFTDAILQNKDKLFPMLRRMCAASPSKRIDCVQALNYLDPNSFIIRNYAKAWLSIVTDGNI